MFSLTAPRLNKCDSRIGSIVDIGVGLEMSSIIIDMVFSDVIISFSFAPPIGFKIAASIDFSGSAHGTANSGSIIPMKLCFGIVTDTLSFP